MWLKVWCNSVYYRRGSCGSQRVLQLRQRLKWNRKKQGLETTGLETSSPTSQYLIPSRPVLSLEDSITFQNRVSLLADDQTFKHEPGDIWFSHSHPGGGTLPSVQAMQVTWEPVRRPKRYKTRDGF